MKRNKVKSLTQKASELGYSVAYCSRVVRGERHNPELLAKLGNKPIAISCLEGRNSTAELLPPKS